MTAQRIPTDVVALSAITSVGELPIFKVKEKSMSRLFFGSLVVWIMAAFLSAISHAQTDSRYNADGNVINVAPGTDVSYVRIGDTVYNGPRIGQQQRAGATFLGTGKEAPKHRKLAAEYIQESTVWYNRMVDYDGSPGHGVVISTTASVPAYPVAIIPPPAPCLPVTCMHPGPAPYYGMPPRCRPYCAPNYCRCSGIPGPCRCSR